MYVFNSCSTLVFGLFLTHAERENVMSLVLSQLLSPVKIRIFAPVGLVLLIWMFFLPVVVQAAGTFIPGNGTRSLGKAGAVVATGEDSDAVYHNPANLGRLRGFGVRFDSSFSIQEASFLRTPEGSVRFDRTDKTLNPAYIPMLSIWYTFKNVGPGHLTLAAFAYGPHGRTGFNFPETEGKCQKSTKGDAQVCNPMPEPGPQRLSMIRTSSPLIYFGLATAYEWNVREDIALRLGGAFKGAYLIASQRQAAIAASLLYDSASSKITAGEVIMDLNGTGITFTGDIGISMTFPTGFSIGLSFLIPMTVELNGTLDVQLGEIFDRFAGVQGRAVDATTSFPLIVRAGVGWKLPDFSVEIAVVSELWSVQQKISVRPKDIFLDVSGQKTKIPDFSIPQELRDSISLRVGMEYNLLKWVYLRLGWLMETGSTPIEKLSAASIDYPKHAITGGVSVKIPGGLLLDLSVMHAFAGHFTITNSPLRPVDVSPTNFADPSRVKPVSNGEYRYAVTVFSVGISGNWLK